MNRLRSNSLSRPSSGALVGLGVLGVVLLFVVFFAISFFISVGLVLLLWNVVIASFTTVATLSLGQACLVALGIAILRSLLSGLVRATSG